MKIHLVACGGAVMHNIALALQSKGFIVSGSDDAIYEPARTRLQAAGLLPDSMGWNESRITNDLDAVILGMHARKDNPELLRAQELGIKIYSFPEFIYENAKEKTRVVIGGSHGKTTTTSMVMHALKYWNKDFDYMVGAQVEGFDTMVKLTTSAPVIILEGDEYLSSAIDLRPKFHLYHPHIAMLTGIAWDHINVFPTYENYVDQFRIFINQMQENAPFIYFAADLEIEKLVKENTSKIDAMPYWTPAHEVINGETFVVRPGKEKIHLKIFGDHNLQNMEGARRVCGQLGMSEDEFYEAISTFKGAAKRLELFKQNNTSIIYRDFAHSPSKLKATLHAVRHQYPSRKLIACFELHTFSSLDKNFLPEYKNSMDEADVAIVYFNEETLRQKNRGLSLQEVKDTFGENVIVMNDSVKLKEMLKTYSLHETNILLMSSGTFDGTTFDDLI